MLFNVTAIIQLLRTSTAHYRFTDVRKGLRMCVRGLELPDMKWELQILVCLFGYQNCVFSIRVHRHPVSESLKNLYNLILLFLLNHFIHPMTQQLHSIVYISILPYKNGDSKFT